MIMPGVRASGPVAIVKRNLRSSGKVDQVRKLQLEEAAGFFSLLDFYTWSFFIPGVFTPITAGSMGWNPIAVFQVG